MPGSQQAGILTEARQKTRFELDYPCYMPNAQVLESHSVIGEPGKQRSELVFAGTFDIAIRQAQVPPPVEPDPTGASRRSIQLFDGTFASFIERTDGSSKALYHLYWERDGFFYELQAFGPYQQQRIILQVARSLQ